LDDLNTTIAAALGRLITGDRALWDIIQVSLIVSLQAIIYITPPALVLAFVTARFSFPGRRLLISLFHVLLALPAIVVGMTLYLIFSRSGPLADLQLLFTQSAMLAGQMLLGFPIVAAIAHAALKGQDQTAWETARTLGASPVQGMLTVLYEARFGVLVAVLVAFGRVIAEVGCALIIGGNILHHTRNITSAIAMEANKGDFTQGIALGIVLLIVALLFIVSLNVLQNRLEDA